MADQSEEQPQGSEPEEATEQPPSEATPEQAASPGVGAALAWTAGSTLLPGLGHLRAGHRLLGGVLLGIFLTLVGGGAFALVFFGGEIVSSARVFVNTDWLLGLAVLTVVGAVLWIGVVIHSYVLLRPSGGRRGLQVLALGVVSLLCLIVATPAAGVLHVSYTAYATMSSVFATDDDEDSPHDDADPWEGEDRVSILLLGNDGHPQREGEIGTRIDSMMVANVDVEYGDVVLIGLPRNMEDLPFQPGSALDERYPEGYDQLLLDVYQTVDEEPEELASDPQAQNPAADTTRDVVGHALGMDLDYYAMVDMRGFRDIINAIGGVEVKIPEPIPWGQQGDMLDEGLQRLTGQEALWYVRSRVNSDDYTRMGRQGCLIQAVAEQADPWTILTSFQELASATEATLGTDIPQSKLRHFIDVAELVPEGDMETLQLTPPQVDPVRPDWIEIRSLIHEAIEEQEHAQAAQEDDGESDGTASEDDPTDEPEDGATEDEELTDWQEWSGADEPSPEDPGRQVGEEPTSLEDICP